jgi:alpha-tubulin suppressor-like RCC1 family protein
LGCGLLRPVDDPPGLTNAIGIATGFDFSVALRSDGSIVAWGGENEFAERMAPGSLNNVTQIAAGGHCVALRDDGTVLEWGWEHIQSLPDWRG